ncbi:MAG: autotransporter-associated beta strand repeat-containing protein [Verrucomicrobiota bacterium]
MNKHGAGTLTISTPQTLKLSSGQYFNIREGTVVLTGGQVVGATSALPTATTGTTVITLTGADTVASLGLKEGLYVLGSGLPTRPVILSIDGSKTFTISAQTVGTLGQLSFLSAGTMPVPVSLETGATLRLDDFKVGDVPGYTSVDGRLGAGSATDSNFRFRGGELIFNGSFTDFGSVTEYASKPEFWRGASVITLVKNNAGKMSLVFDVAADSVAPAQASSPLGASVLFRGDSTFGISNDVGRSNVILSGGVPLSGVGSIGQSTKSIMPWAVIGRTGSLEQSAGFSFATVNSATGVGDFVNSNANIVRPLNASEYAADLSDVTNKNLLFTAASPSTVFSATLAPNSLTVEAGADLSLAEGVRLSLASGGILIRHGSDTTISGGVLNQPSNLPPLNIWTIGSAQLTITSAMSGGNGMGNAAISTVKAGAGTLVIAPPTSQVNGLAGIGMNSLSGQFVLNQGTVRLGAGLKNAIQAGNFFALISGVLDLNGNIQQLGALFSDQNYANANGTITSTGGVAGLIVNQDNTARDWSGEITGDVRFAKQGSNVLRLYSRQSYDQDTLVNGGTLTLTDEGALAGTTGLTVRFGALTLDSANNAKNSNNRLNDAAAVTLGGATFTLLGRAQTNTSESIGAVTIAGGASSFVVTTGGTGVNSAVLNAASLVRQAGGTLLFTGPNGQAGNAARLTFGTIGGVSTATPGGGLQNGIIGGWAVTSTGDFASYLPGLGVGGLGQNGFQAYSSTTLSNASTAAQNIKISANASVSTGVTINALAISGATGTVTITGTNRLTVASGGVLGNATGAWSIGASAGAGRLTSGGSELFLHAGTGALTVNSIIEDGAGRVGLVKFGSGTVTLAAVNTYTGGTTINQGTLTVGAGSSIPAADNPALGLVLNDATFSQAFAGAVASANVVTHNGGASITYFGENTQAGLVFNNLGGSATPTVRTFNTASAAGMAGKLTIGSAGIVVTSANVGTTALIAGSVDFGGTKKTIQVGTIDINGSTDVSPLQASLVLQGIVGTSGGIEKTGDGVLQFNAQSGFAGQVDVVVGGIKTGYTHAGSRFANLHLGADTSFDLNGFSTAWGSLSGTGDVFSSSGTPTLTVGFDGNSTTFSGRLIRFNDAAYGLLTKVGGGTLTLDTAQDANGSFGAISVRGGTLRYADLGRALVSSAAENTVFNLQSGGTLELDNSGTNVSNRLGTAVGGRVNLLGGTLALIGNSAADTTEGIATLGLTTGGSRIELTRNGTRQLNLTITNLAAPGAGSLVITGLAGSAQLNITNANLVVGQGSAGTALAVRGDILVESGADFGFLANAAGTWRALASADLNANASTWESQQNAALSGTRTIGSAASVNTLTVGSAASLVSNLPAAFGGYGKDGASLTLTLANASALLVKSGVVSIDVDVRGASSQAPQFHVISGGTLDLNGRLGLGSSVGFVKAGAGTMNLNARAGFTGVVTVNGGTLNLDSGSDNTIAVGESVTAARVSDLQLNGLTSLVDLLGFSQAFGALTSANPSAGMGGTIRNLGALATLTSTGGGEFGGSISGNLNFVRSGNVATTLTGVSGYTGETIIRGGTLRLIDSGALSGTSSLKVNFGALVWDNFGFNPLADSLPTRLAQTVPVSLRGGTLSVNGAGTVSTLVTLDAVSLLGGANVLDTQPALGSAATVRVNIGNLVRSSALQSTMLFAGRSSLGVTAANTLGQTSLSGSSQVFLSQVNGSGFAASSMVNGIIGGWAVASGDSHAFAIYSDTTGVTQMTTFTSGAISDVTDASGNYNNNATARSITGSKVANSWRLVGAAHDVTFDPGATLTLGAGLLTSGNAAYNLIASNASNTITGAASGAGGDGNLYLYAFQNTTSIQPRITGSSAVVSFGAGTLQLAPQFADNDYAGGTFVNAGTLSLNSRAKAVFVSASIAPTTNTIAMTDTTGFTVGMVIAHANFPGGTKVTAVNTNASLVVDTTSTNTSALTNQTVSSRDSWAALPAGGVLTIGNAIVSMSNTQAGQVGAGTSVVINGGGRLTFGNYSSRAGADLSQTLASITFVNEGGIANPEFSLGTPTGTGFVNRYVLSSANAITATNESLSTVPTIRTGSSTLTSLQFSAASPVITVNAGAGVVGLNISAPIGQHAGMTGALRKSGAGVLAMTGADSTFTSDFELSEGGLMIGASSDGPSPTRGPIGTGTLTIAAGTSLFSDNVERTLHNDVVVDGDFTIGGNGAAALTLAGPIDLGSAARIITFATAGVTTTFDGLLSTGVTTGTALTKKGEGILQLGAGSSLNLGDAGLMIEAGVIKAGAFNNLSASSLLTVKQGAGYDLNGFGQTSNAIAGDGFITNSSGAPVNLVLDVATGTVTFNGALADNHAVEATSLLVLDKQGGGTLELTAASTYAGGTFVNDGRLLITGAGAIGPGTVDITGTLEYALAGTPLVTKTYLLDNVFSGSGSLVFTGADAIAKIGGDSPAANGLNVTVETGTLQIGDAGTVGSLVGMGTLTIGPSATLNFNRSDTFEFGGSIASQGLNDGLLVQAGLGTTKLIGNNTAFNGDVRIDAGILEAAAGATLKSVRHILVKTDAELLISDDNALGVSGFGPDITVQGRGILRFLANTGAEAYGLVNDLIFEGGSVESGTGSSGVKNSLLVTGALTVTHDAVITARNVGFVSGAINAPSGEPTDITVANTKVLDFRGTISDDAYAHASSFNKKGEGTLVLGGDNSGMSGASMVTQGNVDVRHRFALGSGVMIQETSLAAQITVLDGASLSVNQASFSSPGPVAGNIIVDNGGSIGVVAPGVATIGNLQLSQLSLRPGANILFKVWDTSQAAGIGYDKLELGSLDLTGVTSTDRVYIKILSMSSATEFGSAVDFPFERIRTLQFGTYNPGALGNINDLFAFDLSGFRHSDGSSADSSLWSINFNSSDGAITLTAVPEPSTYGFGLGALALAAAAIRRRKRRQAKKA